MNILDHGYVKLIESWGSDERIIESARMSTDGAFRGWPEDEKLLKYLWTNGHTTPFEMAGFTIEVQAPIFVVRQWQRHRTLSYNELSARYSEMPDLFYVPSIERLMAGGQSKKDKQGSGEELSLKVASAAMRDLESANESARASYRNLIYEGVSRELARLVLPVSQYTRMRVSGNLWNWARFLRARLDFHAQWEIREYAKGICVYVEEKYPRTWALFSNSAHAPIHVSTS